MPKVKTAKTAKTIPNPKGWDKPWPFDAELSLWKIPTEEAPAAIRWELRREQNRIDGTSEAGTENEKPWLALNDEPFFKDLSLREWEVQQVNKEIDRPTAVQIAGIGESQNRLAKAKGPDAIEQGRVATDSDRQIARYLGIEVMHSEGLLVTLKIDPAQTHKTILDDFAKILKELDLPNGSGRHTQPEKNLRALAVYRAKLINGGGNFMRRFFDGTPYKGTESEQKRRIETFVEKHLILKAR